MGPVSGSQASAGQPQALDSEKEGKTPIPEPLTPNSQQGHWSQGHHPQTCLLAPTHPTAAQGGPGTPLRLFGACCKRSPRAVEGLQLGSLSEFNLDSERSRGLRGKWPPQGERR